jgi:hypothetical protein
MPTKDQEFTASQRYEQWRALCERTKPRHAATCGVYAEEQGSARRCDCTEYGATAGLHAIAEVHQPVSRARRVTCVEHARTPIWSQLSADPDVCVDCKLVAELRCESCSVMWPCLTASLALTCMDLSTMQGVDEYRGVAA